MNQQQIDAKVAELKAICKEKGYAFFENGDYNLNIIAIRNDDLFDNRFTDTLYVAYKVKGVWRLLVIDWTTMPGTFGGVFNPINVLGITGTAVLKEGQYRGAYQFIDDANNVYVAPYFQQVKPVTVYRDGDRDEVFDRDMPQQTGLFYIMLHAMGSNGYVNNWSIGCQGSQWFDFMQAVGIVRPAVAIYGPIFTYTLLHKNDFAQKPLPAKKEAKG
jgi:hypothetical protein